MCVGMGVGVGVDECMCVDMGVGEYTYVCGYGGVWVSMCVGLGGVGEHVCGYGCGCG